MKKPNITPGPWAPVFDNPLSILQGHTIKAQDEARTPVAEAFKGRGASPKGAAEQKANARAIAALPDLLEAIEEMLSEAEAAGIDTMPGDTFAGFLIACENARQALTKAGYTF